MQEAIGWLTEPFEQDFMRKALLEAALLALVCGFVGTFVVLKGIPFIVDGLSHAILPGIGLAYLLGSSLLVGAMAAALVVALAIGGVSRQARVSEDSAIGIFFTGAFSLGVILISKTHSRSLSEVLFGQIFGVSEEDLWTTLVGAFFVIGLLFLFRKELLLTTFDEPLSQAMGYPVAGLDLLLYVLVAFTVVIALPAVGNILVLALLVTPAATARLLTNSIYLTFGLAILGAFLAGLTGLLLSYHLGWAGGGSIVVMATLFFFLALGFSPRYGLWGYLRKAG